MMLPQERDLGTTRIRNARTEQMSEPRVLFFAGDDVLSNEKHFNPEWKGFGGMYMPHIRTLKKSVNKGMLYRCKFTRIETVMQDEPVAMLHPQDRGYWDTSFTTQEFDITTGTYNPVTKTGFKQVRLDPEAPPHQKTVVGTVDSPHVVFKPRYPEPDVKLATKVNQPNGTAGVVEIVALRGAPLAEVQEAQSFFFPEWIDIQKGNTDLPPTIRELENHIQNRIAAIPTDWSREKQNKYRMIGTDMLKSCTEFRIGAEAYLKFVEDADREAKVKGLAYPYPEKASIFGALCELKRKDDLVAGESSSVDRLARAMESRDSKELELRQKELELKERELALKERELGLGKVDTAKEYAVNETKTPFKATDVDTSLTPEYGQYVCGRAKANGEPCGRTVDVEGQPCFQHAETVTEDAN